MNIHSKWAWCCVWAFAILTIGAVHVNSQEQPQPNWPQFRGGDSTGVSENRGLPDKWSATENIEWKAEIEGRGWGSPIVWGDNIFLSSVVNSAETEPLKKGLYFGGDRPSVPQTKHQWRVLCLDLTTGKTRWQQTVREGTPTGPIHLKNSYASETPVTDGKYVYVCFGGVGIYCFDFAGKQIWNYDLPARPTRNGWGTAASPVLHGDVLYYVDDNDQQSMLIAIDKLSGKKLWSVDRDEKSNWATPFIWSHDANTEIVTAGTRAVRSYDLKGNILWSIKGMSSITIATPYVVDGLLYVSSGYILDPVKALYAVRPGSKGDLTLADGQTSNEYIAWSSMTIAPYNPSTLVHADRLFVLYDRGTAACYRAKTGETLYASKALKRGTAFTASPWCYNGKFFCLNEDGDCVVIRESDSMEILHTNSLAEGELCLSTPSIAGDRLLIRADQRLYCIRNQQ